MQWKIGIVSINSCQNTKSKDEVVKRISDILIPDFPIQEKTCCASVYPNLGSSFPYIQLDNTSLFPETGYCFFFFFQLYVSHVLRWLPMVSSLYFKLLWARMSLNIFLHDTWHAPCIKMVMMKTLQIMSPKVMSGQVTGELSQDLGYSLLLNQLRQSHPLFPF